MQLRLRSLYQIIGYNLETDKSFETCWFYFTLHRSSMSSPLYTSEPIDHVSPKWSSLEVPTLHATGLSTANGIYLSIIILRVRLILDILESPYGNFNSSQ